MDLRLVTASPSPAEVEIRLRRDGELVARARATIAAGEDVLRLREKAPGPGLHRYDVEITAIDPRLDEAPEDNSGSAFVRVRGQAAALVLEGDAGKGAFIARSLAQSAFTVDEAGATGVPADLGGLAGYDVVILSDIRASDLSTGQLDALAGYVRESRRRPGAHGRRPRPRPGRVRADAGRGGVAGLVRPQAGAAPRQPLRGDRHRHLRLDGGQGPRPHQARAGQRGRRALGLAAGPGRSAGRGARRPPPSTGASRSGPSPTRPPSTRPSAAWAWAGAGSTSTSPSTPLRRARQERSTSSTCCSSPTARTRSRWAAASPRWPAPSAAASPPAWWRWAAARTCPSWRSSRAWATALLPHRGRHPPPRRLRPGDHPRRALGHRREAVPRLPRRALGRHRRHRLRRLAGAPGLRVTVPQAARQRAPPRARGRSRPRRLVGRHRPGGGLHQRPQGPLGPRLDRVARRRADDRPGRAGRGAQGRGRPRPPRGRRRRRRAPRARPGSSATTGARSRSAASWSTSPGRTASPGDGARGRRRRRLRGVDPALAAGDLHHRGARRDLRRGRRHHRRRAHRGRGAAADRQRSRPPRPHRRAHRRQEAGHAGGDLRRPAPPGASPTRTWRARSSCWPRSASSWRWRRVAWRCPRRSSRCRAGSSRACGRPVRRGRRRPLQRRPSGRCSRRGSGRCGPGTWQSSVDRLRRAHRRPPLPGRRRLPWSRFRRGRRRRRPRRRRAQGQS